MAWLVSILACFILSRVENEKFLTMAKIIIKYFFQILTVRLFNFSGRSSRRAFYVHSVLLAAIFTGRFRAFAIANSIEMQILNGLIIAILLIAGISLSVRRIHDVGLSGWWFVPCIFFPLLFMGFIFIPGTPNTNKFGANPRDEYYGYLK